MKPNIKFYKIKFIKEFNEKCDFERNQLISNLRERIIFMTLKESFCLPRMVC